MKLLKELIEIAEAVGTCGAPIYNGNIDLSNCHPKLSKIPPSRYDYDEVTGNFYCHGNQLETLEGSPKKVEKDFYCSNNKLKSLKGGPEFVGGEFHCNGNQLASLEGAPKEISGAFVCHHNQLKSLKDIHKNIKKIKGTFAASHNPITSHVLGIFLIEGVTNITLGSVENAPIDKVSAIINKYIKQGKSGMVKAQRELIENDLDDYAEI